MATQQALFRSQSGAMSGRRDRLLANPVFGQYRFGQFNPIWPIHFLTILFLDRPIWAIQFWPLQFWTNPILANPFFGSGVCHVGVPKGEERRVGPNPEKIGPRRVGAQNVALFLPSPLHFVLFHSFWVTSRGILVFSMAGPSNVHVWIFRLSCESSSGFGAVPAFETPKFNEEDTQRE